MTDLSERATARPSDAAGMHIRNHSRKDEHEFAEASDSLWRIIIAPTIWVVHFLACYITTAIVCANTPADSPVVILRWFILSITLACLAGISAIGWRSWLQWDFVNDRMHVQDLPTREHRHEFLGHASFLLSIVSFIGVSYVAMPAIFLENCR